MLTRARRREFELFVCPKILEEFERVLSHKLKVPASLILEAITLVKEAAIAIEPQETVQGVCKDRYDDEILACAISAKAEYLVTGDRDLLEIKRFKGVTIVTPRDFENLFED